MLEHLRMSPYRAGNNRWTMQTISRKDTSLIMHTLMSTFSKVLPRFKGKRQLLAYYLAGFVDGEGSFSVAIIRHPSQRLGWMINPVFQVYQHEKHREILELFQEYFGVGNINRKSGTHPVLTFCIDSRRNLLERVIPFFERYPLITKANEFQRFRQIIIAMERKEHWNVRGFKRLVSLAYEMNQQGKGRKHTKAYIFSTLPKE